MNKYTYSTPKKTSKGWACEVKDGSRLIAAATFQTRDSLQVWILKHKELHSKRAYLVGFDFERMEKQSESIGAHFDRPYYEDRVQGFVADSEQEAINMFLEWHKEFLFDVEKPFVTVLDETSVHDWEMNLFHNSYVWTKRVKRRLEGVK